MRSKAPEKVGGNTGLVWSFRSVCEHLTFDTSCLMAWPRADVGAVFPSALGGLSRLPARRSVDSCSSASASGPAAGELHGDRLGIQQIYFKTRVVPPKRLHYKFMKHLIQMYCSELPDSICLHPIRRHLRIIEASREYKEDE